MNCTLTFEYEFSRDDDDFGWLLARLQTPDFSGRNGMWVQWQDLTEFAASLSRYPFDAANPAACEWGFGDEAKFTPVTKLSLSAAGVRGGLIADVFLANYYEPANFAQSRFQTDYPSVTEFQRQLERMMRREGSDATLIGSKLDHS
ncbi:MULTISPECIES: hypothetical protein [unclassified Sphingomonas]|uniref:hypothetical protein n=1 Tax=unclassified Sphingomonas TaxID=196159 RepID=UPI002150DCA0|nr:MULTISPECIES: hypothetical protein [unclassified Sphingomonas]MCR5870268.1 hypothetical protein [Sphingomonas sp. J344]UUX98044.1 hypothetical protein LRS08_10425 [Sphingomonas sp. J315]